MNINKNISFIILTITIGLSLVACNDNEVLKPIIHIEELGINNSKIVQLGNDLHINAEIIADAKIKTVQVIIHQADNHARFNDFVAWQLDTTYTKFEGLKNTNFHEHLEIPLTVDTGRYHFHLNVVDLEGYQRSAEDYLSIEIAD